MKLVDANIDLDIEIPDLATMYSMSEEDYRKYVQSGSLFFFDHHAILRDEITGRPIAATLEQMDILLEELHAYRNKMRPHM